MKVALIYPYVVPKADEYRPDLRRFVDTFLAFLPGGEFDLFICPCNGTHLASTDDHDILEPLSYNYGPAYYGEGRDIGCHQFAANWLDPKYDFAVFCSSQVHFHRAGWLARMIEAREKLGPSLYGAMGSYEQKRPHIRTCFYGCDPKHLRDYPEVVNSRVKSLQFESQPNNFQGFLERQGMTGYMVAWDGIYGPKDYRTPPNVFRRGDQSNCLVWDRHTAIYASDTPAQRAITEALAEGK